MLSETPPLSCRPSMQPSSENKAELQELIPKRAPTTVITSGEDNDRGYPVSPPRGFTAGPFPDVSVYRGVAFGLETTSCVS